MASTCDACRRIIGLWDAVFTSECTHTFHLHCVSGAAACPVCAARWTHAPATSLALASTTTDSSSAASASASFGQPAAAAAANDGSHLFGQTSSSQDSLSGSHLPPPLSVERIPFGQPSPSTASQDSLSGAHLPPSLSVGRIPFGQRLPSTVSQDSSSSLLGARLPPPLSAGVGRRVPLPWTVSQDDSSCSATASLSGAHLPRSLSVGRRISFGLQQQLAPVCPLCDAAMRRGQATVTSECNHTFHLRCIASLYWARSVCPVCSARWRHCVSLAPPPCPFSRRR